MKLRFFLAGICAFLAGSIYAQQPSLPSKCEAFFPTELAPKGKSQTIKESDVNKFLKSGTYGQTGNKTKKFWKVVSDRDDNPVYSTATSTTKIGSLKWNQSLTILKIQGDRALVAEGSFRDVDYPKLPINAKCIGWVPMSKLLLWESCPTNDAGIYYKALIAYYIDGQKSTSASSGKIYFNPDKLSNSVALQSSDDFFYILKRENGLVLLATQYSLYSGYTSDVLYGWVNEKSYVPWNQRTCLEPNWDPADLQYLKQNAPISTVYHDKAMKTVASTHDYRTQTGRMDGEILRYPLLDDNIKDASGDIKIYNISTFGVNPALDKAAVDDARINLKIREDILKSMSTVNICLVIDGTESMRPYYPAIKEAIKEGCKQFVSRDVKVSVVIYRDKPHKKDGKSYEIEAFPQFTNPNNPGLMSWLETGGVYGFNDSADRTAEESLYKGIDVASDKFKGHERESNIMIIIGDCGDNASYPNLTKTSLSKKLMDYNVQLLVFQIANKTTPKAYGSFNQDMTLLMKSCYDSFFSALNVNVRTYIKEISGGTGYVGANDGDSKIYVGSIQFPTIGQTISTEQLKNGMISSIDDIRKAVDEQLSIIRRGTNGPKTITVIDKEFYKKIVGGDAGAGDFTYVSFKGYTKKYAQDGYHTFYKPVLFISSKELRDLLIILNPVKNLAAAPTLDRKPYVDALKALIRSFVPDITPAAMEQMGMSEIMALAAGLNEAARSIAGDYTIAEIADKDIVPQAKYVSILKQFAEKVKKIEKIQNTNYQYVREFNGDKHYWIPVEDLP